jgi:hypothetical protein
MASIPAVRTKMVVFDTAAVDLTEELSDPVELLFGVQLGGGTDIHRALGYCQQIITRPTDSVMVFVTDLFSACVQLIVLLALSDDGAPGYDHAKAQFFSNLGVSVFAFTPDLFPSLIAAALRMQDVAQGPLRRSWC